MKNKFLKSVMLPLATVVLGTAGAFTTTSMGKAPLADSRGFYYQDAAHPCVQSITCQTVDNGIICQEPTTLVQLYGKTTPSAAMCEVPLWKKP